MTLFWQLFIQSTQEVVLLWLLTQTLVINSYQSLLNCFTPVQNQEVSGRQNTDKSVGSGNHPDDTIASRKRQQPVEVSCCYTPRCSSSSRKAALLSRLQRENWCNSSRVMSIDKYSGHCVLDSFLEAPLLSLKRPVNFQKGCYKAEVGNYGPFWHFNSQNS